MGASENGEKFLGVIVQVRNLCLGMALKCWKNRNETIDEKIKEGNDFQRNQNNVR